MGVTCKKCGKDFAVLNPRSPDDDNGGICARCRGEEPDPWLGDIESRRISLLEAEIARMNRMVYAMILSSPEKSIVVTPLALQSVTLGVSHKTNLCREDLSDGSIKYTLVTEQKERLGGVFTAGERKIDDQS